jgi:hypothetical protein
MGHATKPPEAELSLLKDWIEGKITQVVCAGILDLSVRQIKRKCKSVRSSGLLKHGNQGKTPVNRISDEIRNHILECCKTSFKGFGPTLVRDEYSRMYSVEISAETVRQLMISNELWFPKEKKVKQIHHLRERMSCYGEMVQADGTEYDWLGDGIKHVLLVFIDDATSSLLHAVLVKSESTASYMQALNDYLLKHGRPMCLYTDKHGVFRVNMPSASEDAQTQFARAMEELDIKMIQANSPQAKGRVERANRTLQDRLAKRLQLIGIKTIEEANRYITETYIAEYNHLFAVEPTSPVNVHRPLKEEHHLTQILALHSSRVVSKNHTIQYDNKVIQIEETGVNLHKEQATVVAKLGEIISVLVHGKAVKCKALNIRPKQSSAVCTKTVNLAAIQERDVIQSSFNQRHENHASLVQ